jgi:4-hydroxy-3-methylbut-2-enyl diphosphate reductase
VAGVPPGATVLFSAHGVTPAVRARARARGLRVVDATCPFVIRVHADARRYARQGYAIVLVGYRRHDEVVGVAGEAPGQVTVVENEAEAGAVRLPQGKPVAVLTQTTLSPEQTEGILAVLRRRFRDLRMPYASNICYATRNRQHAVRAVARRAGAVVVLGARNSSNSNRLVEVARVEGKPAYLVSVSGELKGLPLAGVRVLGLTAGASTPEYLVREAVALLRRRGFRTVRRHTVVTEHLRFPLPKALRAPDRKKA